MSKSCLKGGWLASQPAEAAPPEPDHLKHSIRFRTVLQRFLVLFASDSLRDWMMGLFLLYVARKSPEIFGYFAFAFSAGAVALKVVDFGFNDFLIKRLGKSGVKNLDVVSSVNLIKIALLVLAAGGLIAFCRIMDYSPELSRFVVLIGLGMGMASLGDSLYMVYRIMGKQKVESAIKVGARVVGLIWAVSILELGIDPVWASSLLFVDALLNLFVAGLVLRSKILLVMQYSWKMVRTIVVMGVPFFLIAFLSTLCNQTNIFFLETTRGTTSVAVYMASWMVVDAVSCAVSAHLLGGVLYPVFSQQQNSPAAHALALTRNTLVWLLALAWPICLILYSQSELMIQLIYTDEYGPAAGLQRILVWTIPVAFCQNVCLYFAMARARIRPLVFIFAVGLGFNLLLDLLLIASHGSQGAAWVILGTKLFNCLLVLLYCQRSQRLTRLEEWIKIAGLAGLLASVYLLGRLFLPDMAAVIVALAVYLWCLRLVRAKLLSNYHPTPARSQKDAARGSLV